MAAVAYWRDPYGDFGDTAYLVGAQFMAMAAWTAFVVALIFIIRESKKEPFFMRIDRRI